MAGVLIRMKVAILRHAWRGGQSSMLWSGAILGLLLAVGTLSAVVSAPVERALDTIAIAFLLWAAIWLMLPVLGGTGGDPLRPEGFRLLAIPPRRLAVGLLVAGGVGVMPAVSALAFTSLVVVAARLDLPSIVVALAAVALTLALVITLSRVVVGALGRAMETRLGLELAAIQYALIVALSLFWIPLIVVNTERAPGAVGSAGAAPIGPDLAAVARLLPTGWGVVAVDAAGRSDWAITLAALAGLAVVIGLAAWAWTALVSRRLELAPGSSRPARRRLAHLPMDRPGGGLLAASPLNAVIARELRSWVRHPRRGLELRVAIWSAVLLAILPALLGTTVLWPWAGAIVVVIAGNGLANVYGMDGTSFWLTLLAPDAERIDVRGRQWAWLLVVGSMGIAATILLTLASGHLEAVPWVAAILPALLGGAVGLGILLAVITPAPLPERRGGGDPLDLGDDPTTGGNLMVHGVVMSLAVPVLAVPAILATAALPILGVAVGVVTGVLYAWIGGALTIRRLERAGPETLERLRSRPAARPAPRESTDFRAGLPRWRSIARNVLLLAGALLIFAQGLAALLLKLTGSEAKVWFAALYLPEPWPVPAAFAAVLLGLAAWVVAWWIGRPRRTRRSMAARGGATTNRQRGS